MLINKHRLKILNIYIVYITKKYVLLNPNRIKLLSLIYYYFFYYMLKYLNKVTYKLFVILI